MGEINLLTSFIMGYSKGGRGRQAPYTTTHVRVPDPLKAEVDSLICKWRSLVDSGELSPTEAVAEVFKMSDSVSVHLNLHDALIKAQEILAQKKSANESMIKLLTAIYGVELSKDELRKEHKS